MKRILQLSLSLSLILLPVLPAFAQDQSAPAGQTKLVATPSQSTCQGLPRSCDASADVVVRPELLAEFASDFKRAIHHKKSTAVSSKASAP